MNSITLVFRSNRDPGKRHRVRLMSGPGKKTVGVPDTLAACTCPAGRRGGKCKHIRLLSLLADHGTDDEIRARWGYQPGW